MCSTKSRGNGWARRRWVGGRGWAVKGIGIRFHAATWEKIRRSQSLATQTETFEVLETSKVWEIVLGVLCLLQRDMPAPEM